MGRLAVASVGYDANIKYFGGAPMAAVSFKRFSDTLVDGVSDLITFNGSGLPSEYDISYIWGVEYKYHRWADFADALNKYDFVYFSSPMGIKYKRKEQEFYVDKYKKLEIPFVIHIHGEYDERYYDIEKVEEILNMRFCVGLVVMYKGYWDRLAEKAGKPVYEFHPCTLPDYLIKDEFTLPVIREGILFAHRFASVKRPDLLARLSLSKTFQERMCNVITSYGVSTGMMLMWERDTIDVINPVWNRIRRYHNIFDAERMYDLYLDHKFFWNVSGSSKTKYEMVRLDLAGVEALSCGCIPFVNKDYCPDWIKNFSVLVDINDVDLDDICDQVLRMHELYSFDFLNNLQKAILGSECSYWSVEDKVKAIISGGK